MTNPTLITTPFAENGDKNTIPESVGANPQNATMQAGFPPITQQKISEGGIPPERNDFNGILNLYGQHIVHLNKGLPYEFDQAFADAIGGYPLNARLMLDNGDIVRSTVANNTVNPNVDMTGWDIVEKRLVVLSVSELSLISNPQNGDVIKVLSYHTPNYGTLFPCKGGGVFVYDSSKSAENDGGVVINGWIRQLENNVLNPYMFGAKGDLIFNTGEVLNRLSGTDDTIAFQNMLNMNKYVIHTNISKGVSSGAYAKYVFDVPLASYYITDTLPIRTFTKIDWNNSTVFFNPSTAKDMFSTPRQEMADAYLISTGWNTQTISMVEMSNAVFIGNLTRTSTVHANKCIDGGNAYKWRLSNIIIERFTNGLSLYGIDTSAWTGGSRKGNFYENVVENLAINECVQGFYNTSNALQATNLTIGGGYIVGQQYTNKFDYLLINTAAGASFNGFNIAPASEQFLTKGLIYDACHGSYYGGGYSEWFNILFDLEMPARFDGFKFDASHLFKRPQDACVRFTQDTFSRFDLATGVRTPSRHFTSGRKFSNYLNFSGFQFGAGATPIGNFFKFCPQYDFKYGMYGAYTSNIDLIYDVKRFETVDSGFTTANGIRLINPTASDIDIILPCANQVVGAKVCMLYRPISGTFSYANLKSNAYVNASNERISIGELMYDYGNGWLMAACEVTAEYHNYGNVTITIPANSQVEIEHIGAYTGGVPLFPTYLDYEPKINAFTTEWLNSDFNITGGTFAVNDTTKDAPATGTTNEGDCYIVTAGRTHPTRYTAGGSNNLTATTTNVIDLSPVSVMQRVGSGVVMNITQSGATNAYTVVGRVYESGSFTNKVKVYNASVTLNAGGVTTAASYIVPPTARGATNYTRRNISYTKTLAANEIGITELTLAGAYLGAPVLVGVSPPLGANSRMWAEVISTGNVRLYHQNLTASSTTLTGAIVSLKIT